MSSSAARRALRATPVLVLALVLSQLALGQAALPTVRDVGVAAGISEPSKTWSANVADVNNDGWDDVMIVRHGYQGRLFVNNKNGTFTLQQVFPGRPSEPRDRHDCAFGDVNNDGRMDMYCTMGADGGSGTFFKANELFIQNASGVFVDRTSDYGVEDPQGRGRWTTFIDVNHDPYPDLFVGNLTEGEVPSPNRLFINQGGTSFREAPEYGVTKEERAYCAVPVDINVDGWTDLVVCSSKFLRVYKNNNGTSFTDIAKSLGLAARGRSGSISFADLDKDGDKDLVQITGGQVRVRIRTGLNGATFESAAFAKSYLAPKAAPVGDFDGDGDVDIMVVNGGASYSATEDGPDEILLNNGNGRTWTALAVPDAATGLGDHGETIDYNKDGKADFIVLNGAVNNESFAGPALLLTNS